ncbi:uncharacterized protein PRCAT00004036001 [Priceomyces carsonii]|uniref:uncharacterized protein n=1 Tax=Priceomyces carsonii TaxID=28549 RepID=UPI002EDB7638|nr:unnamed protein product [Priceomyces carsonii]
MGMIETLKCLTLLLLKVWVSLIFRSLLNAKSFISSKNESTVPKDEDILRKNQIINAKDIIDIAEANGYIIREHVITTKDGYLLVVHKLEKSVTESKVSEDIVYFHHGLLTNSELFLLGDKHEKNLPFLLLERGYEIWLGNNRGNKYSRKHLNTSVSDDKFWDFSLDEFAFYDIPDTVNYILSNYSPGAKLTYIGFSQGCSQLFASLSLNASLNTKVNLFVGLSPAVVPRDLNHPVFKVLVKETARNTNFLFSIFGKRALLPSVSFWSYIMGPQLYEKVVDTSLSFLFGWTGKNISASQKSVGYPHMFSNSSVKSLMHWFQIIHAKRFQMFDETSSCGNSNLSTFSECLKSKAHKVAPFPISHHLNVPMILFYGDSDILVDIETTKLLLLNQNHRMKDMLLEVVECKGYEHMDTLWADDVYEKVFEKVVDTLEKSRQGMPSALSSALTLKELYFEKKVT